MDGRVARALNAQSEFGKELDSLSDVISFGVAPAFIMYVVAFSKDESALAWIVTAIFPICGALRLARFNVVAGTPGYFIGLPIPAQAVFFVRWRCSTMSSIRMYCSYRQFLAFLLDGQHREISELQEGRHSEGRDLDNPDRSHCSGWTGNYVPRTAVEDDLRTSCALCAVRFKKTLIGSSSANEKEKH